MYHYLPEYFPDYFAQYIHINLYIHKSVFACGFGVLMGFCIIYLARVYSGEINFNAKKKLPY